MKKDELKYLIAKNEAPKVIDILLQLIDKSNSNSYNEIVMLSLRYDSLKDKARLGLLGNEEYNIENSKIVHALLNFIDNIKLEETKHKSIISFPAPKFKGYVSNESEILRIVQKLGESFCVLVEGLSGSGKTYMVSELVEKYLYKMYDSPVIWYSAYEGYTIDTFFIDLSIEFNFISNDTKGKIKELINILNSIDSILIIDDSDYIDGFFELIQKYSHYQSEKARFILISKKSKVGNIDSSNFYFSKVIGFDKTQLNNYLSTREIDILPLEITDKLWSSTEGLPLAISIFCSLVKNFGIDPNSLLQGDILYNDRIDLWFKDLMRFIGNSLEKLLKNLSLCDEPFNDSVVKIFCKKIQIENNEQALENLIRLFLIQQYSPYRWAVHKLISEKAKLTIDESIKKEGYIELAKYSVRGYNYHKHKLFDEKELQWKIKSIRYFQKGEDYITSEIILESIAKTAKTFGYYEIFIRLLKNQLIKRKDGNLWLHYHLLHCLLIQGKYFECNRIFSSFTIEQNCEKNLLLSFVRLKAEVAAEMGDYKGALTIMESHLEELDDKSLKDVTRSQFLSVLTGLYTENGNFEKAVDTFLKLKKSNKDSKYDKAISNIRYASIMLKQKNISFETSIIDEAISIFQEVNDKRGLSWSMSIKAVFELNKGKINDAQRHIIDSIAVTKHIGVATREYYNTLNSFYPHFKNDTPNSLFIEEFNRIEKFYKKSN